MTNKDNNWLRHGAGEHPRLEVSIKDKVFAPHRHDTYAIGVTLAGVQTFDYRGTTRHSQRGGVFVLHPDEVHDGRPGTDDGFRYRTLYLQPADIQEVLSGRPLPFIEGGQSSDPRLLAAVSRILDDLDQPLSHLEYEDCLYDIASCLEAITTPGGDLSICHYRAVQRARDYLEDHLEQSITLTDLERVTEQDRWQLSRDFRRAYGTSPYRYLTMRRLEKARHQMRSGHTIADAAHANGFSDQSHFTRHFRKAYGMTPKAWRTIVL